MKSTLQKLLYLTIFCTLFINIGYSQVSKQQAITFVMDSIVGVNSDSVNVYMEENLQSNLFYIISPFDSINATYSSYWIFFIDDQPEYLWGHQCRYIFIDYFTGAVLTINKQLPPHRYKFVLEQVSVPLDLSRPDFDFTVQYLPENTISQNNNLFAVMFTGNDGGSGHMWSALSHMYCALIEHGFPEENIFVLSYDGTAGPETNVSLDLNNDLAADILPYPCSIYQLDLIFQQLSDEMDEGDMLYVFANTHGVKDDPYPMPMESNFVLWENELLDDDVFANMLEGISCAQMIINIYSCYAGGFTDELLAINNNSKKTILTCTNGERPYYRDAVFQDNALMDQYNYLICSALRGGHPDIINFAPWHSPYTIGNSPFFNYLFPDSNGEINFDFAANGGNNNNRHEINETILYGMEYDEQFLLWGNKIYECGFQEDLLSLFGISGKVENNQTIQGNFLIGGDLSINNGTTLELNNSVKFFLNDSKITVDDLSNLDLNNYIEINGNSSDCDLLVYGDIQVGQNVTFNSVDITIYNSNLQTNFQNCAFIGSALFNGGSLLNINNSVFSECVALWSINGDVTITGSNFNCTWLLLENMVGDPANSVNISNNDFVGSSGCNAGIYISDYDYFNIEYNTLDNCGIGIQVYESGNGASGNQNIFENEIMNCNDKAILVYNSTASIAGNNVHDNNNGIWLANSSNVALLGNAAAQSYSETQQIKDNTVYEVYSSKHSFPWYFRHNAIIDEDNTGNPVDPLLYFDSPCTQQRDIRYNCWGNSFNASEDLYPSICFVYSPTWCPPSTTIEGGAAEQLYITANTQFETGNYAEAQTSYQSVINLYPETEFAQASMRDLFSLEMFIGNDYAGLKQYYNTNTTIQSDSTLSELAVFFSNKCDVELENWQAAIDHYESIINNPPTPEDSIYAIIDLGYTYMLIQNSGYKSYHSGTMTEHIPTSREQFFDRREYYLSLFPLNIEPIHGAQQANHIAGKLLQNNPNPFSDITKISYEVLGEGLFDIKVKVYDHVGSEVWSVENHNVSSGRYSVEFNANNLPSGMYFYTLFVNGVLADTRRMILVK